jgi:glycosyltransferase involved in cell wall biosynthesis
MVSVDVAIPNYNYGRYLRGCIESVLAQDIEALRVLIIDNASTDDSAEVARELAREDPRVEIRIREKNLGAAASFNEAVEWAAADYFLLLCSDDYLVPGSLRRASTFMRDHPDVHLTYGVCRRDPPGLIRQRVKPAREEGTWRVRSGSAFVEMLCRLVANPVSGPTAVVRTEVQKRVGYYRPELRYTNDLEMWLRFACHGDVAETDNLQACARVHKLNQSATVAGVLGWNRELEAAFTSFFENAGRGMPDASRQLDRVRRCLADRAYWSAISALLHAEHGSIDLMKYALRRRPMSLLVPPFGYVLRSHTFWRLLPALAPTEH